jgi:deoxycytidylate deaminase
VASANHKRRSDHALGHGVAAAAAANPRNGRFLQVGKSGSASSGSLPAFQRRSKFDVPGTPVAASWSWLQKYSERHVAASVLIQGRIFATGYRIDRYRRGWRLCSENTSCVVHRSVGTSVAVMVSEHVNTSMDEVHDEKR